IAPGRCQNLPVHHFGYFVGDTIAITVQAHDDRKLGWVGWRMTQAGLADSVPLIDTVANVTLRIPVTPAMDGPQRFLTVFLRDSVGNYANNETYIEDLIDGTRHTFQSVAGTPDRIDDIGYSAAAARALVLSNGTTTVLALDSLRRVATVATPRGGS